MVYGMQKQAVGDVQSYIRKKLAPLAKSKAGTSVGKAADFARRTLFNPENREQMVKNLQEKSPWIAGGASLLLAPALGALRDRMAEKAMDRFIGD